MSDQLQEMSEALAESIATSLWEFNHTLLNTGLSPDDLLDCALRVFAREVPAFANVSQESLQLFADSLAGLEMSLAPVQECVRRAVSGHDRFVKKWGNLGALANT